jgi:hypothetical protein
MSFDDLLNTTCSVSTVVQTRDATSRGAAPVKTLRHSNVPCRLDGATGSEYKGDNRVLGKMTHVLFLSPRYVLRETDVVTISGTDYNVLVVTDGGGHGHHTEAALELVRLELV